MRELPSDTAQALAGLDTQGGLAVLADSLPQLVWSTSANGSSDYFNTQWVEFTGQPATASFGVGWMSFLHPQDVPTADAAWTQAVHSGSAYQTRYRLRRHDGVYVWFLARSLPVRAEDGRIVRWMGTCTEIDDEVRTAEQLDLLSQELAHRIKNIFAVVTGLVSLTARNNPEFAGIAAELRGRILSLGRAHDMIGLGQSIQGPHIDASNLRRLCERVLEPFMPVGVSPVEITGDAVSIDDRSATPLAMFINELATNSAKHGALSVPGGEVRLDLSEHDGVVLTWTESGGPDVSPPERRGFGHRLMRMSIEAQLGGTLEFNWQPNGVTVLARLPSSSMSRRTFRS